MKFLYLLNIFIPVFAISFAALSPSGYVLGFEVAAMTGWMAAYVERYLI